MTPQEVLSKFWGYSTFRPMQELIVENVLKGRDTLALMPTGGGKSLCFQVPALVSGRMCLVVSPLIALMKDQVEQLRKRGIAARAVTSDMSWAEIENTLEAAAVGKLSFLYVSPERLASDVLLGRLPRMPIGSIAVDEAHCISQWGYDFRPAYVKVREIREKLPNIPVLALTASATAAVAADIMAQLGFPRPNLVRGDFRRPELVLWVSRGEDKYGRLLRIMEHVPGTSIVYMRERRGTVRIAQFLRQHGIAAEAYNAGLAPTERDRIQRAWSDGTLRCVVATNAFGMGIDKADVRCVVHMEAPPDLESYYQEAGRAGRDGATAHAFLLVGPGDEERSSERALASFPPLSEVRRVYQAFADMHGIALGSGMQETYSVDLRALADRIGSPVASVAHSLKALELDGAIALSDGARSPSRVFMLADRGILYNLRLGDPKQGRLIETLLRLYGGLFEEAATIDEGRIAKLLGSTEQEVVKRLEELDKMRILSYRPRSDSPSATLLLARQDAQRLTLSPAALIDRQRRALDRLHAMRHYLLSNGRCRTVVLLEYFGEQSLSDCGRCDVCSRRKSFTAPTGVKDASDEPLASYDVDIERERWMRDEYGAQVEGNEPL